MKDKMLEWTGERYLPFVDPKVCGAEIHYEHLHRYAFAAQFVKGKKVLDFASGEGYGSYMLSKEAELVIGVEIDEKTVKHASSSYISDNLEFMQGSILKVPIEGEKMFDAIICFEAMEHVEAHEELMNEVKRLLKDDGVFIVSSPNKKVYTDDPDYHNPFHQKELYFDEFKNLLNNYFTETIFFGQRVYTASNLWCLTSKEAPNNYSEFVIKKGDDEFYFSDGKNPLYFIAVASNADLNERYNKRSYLVDASNILIRDYKRQINEFNVVVQERDEHIRNLDAHISNISGQLTEKDKQITELNATVQDKDAHIQNLEVQIDAISSQLKEKEQQLDMLNAAVQGKDAHIQNLEVQIDAISSQLKEKEQQLDMLNAAVQGKDAHIQNLEVQIDAISSQLKEKEQQLDMLNAAVQGKDAHIQNLEVQIDDISSQLKEKELQIDSVSGQLNDKKERLREIDTENLKILSELNSIKAGVTWRTVMKWHSSVEKLMPPMTRRRRWYDLGIIGLRTITNEGWNSFWWKYKQHRASKRVVRSRVKSTELESPKLDIRPVDLEKDVDLIEKNISIIIPTKNAGPDFDLTLEKIRTQKGIKEIELIIVDSGSTDNTVMQAKKYGAKVYSIKPEEFNHGLTRNYGAEKVTGDYILFMVQDAIPIGNYWLYKMVKVLESDTKIAAVTCRQIPRSDADLFASYTMWNHYRVMEFNNDKIVSTNKENFKKLTEIEKRKLAGIDDVCSCIKRDIFDVFKFKKVDFAEDIELGIRLIESGYKLGFLYSVGVIHSHNRNSDYIMSRYYVDSKSLAKMFDNAPFIKEQDVDLVLNAILSLYDSLKWSIHTISPKYENDTKRDSFFFALKDSIGKGVKRHTSNEKGEKPLDDLLSHFEKICNIKPLDTNFLRDNYFFLLDSFHEYLKSVGQSYEVTELVRSLYNLFAVCCGSYLGNLYSYRFSNDKMQQIDTLLRRGV